MLRFNRKGFTLTELLISVVIAVLGIGMTVATYMFIQQTWVVEYNRTLLRQDLLGAMETIKRDLSMSSSTYISFYPSSSNTYTAISLPAVDVDSDGLLPLNSFDEIDWTRTIVYHLYTEADGSTTLRRTVIDPRDNTLTDSERYAQLKDIVDNGVGGSGSTTDTSFLKNVDSFEITSQSGEIDFYTNSSTAIRSEKMVFGWVKLDAGDHTIRLTSTGKNSSSSGYAFGIDTISIEPAGEDRDVEYYNSSFAPSGMIDSNGKTITTVSGTEWSNDNYLEYSASAVDDYIEFTDYYDLYRESDFSDANIGNTFYSGTEKGLSLERPEDRETGEENVVWSAPAQTNDTDIDGADKDLPAYPVTVRNILQCNVISMEGDAVRVKFLASSDNPIKIAAAYITRRNGTSGEDGLANQSTTGLTVDQYHRHQQLFFKDIYDGDDDGDTSEILAEGWIPENSEIWTEWTAFPLVTEDPVSSADVDYFVTFCIPDLDAVTFPSSWTAFDPSDDDARSWHSISVDRSYYVSDGDYTTEILLAAGTPVWSGTYTVNTSNYLYLSVELDLWEAEGTVESDICDTGMASPVYNEINYSEVRPSNTDITMKARTSSNSDMSGASGWDSITGSTANPYALSLGTDRYVQFMAELTADPYWEGADDPSVVASYKDYIDKQVGFSFSPRFPVESDFSGSGTSPMITGVNASWVDDVEIDWPGDERICAIAGYIAQKDSYGMAKITVDDTDLLSVINVKIELSSSDIQGRVAEETASIQVDPMNTGN